MEYLSQIFSFIVGAIAGGVAVKIHIHRSTNTDIKQSNNKVGGDMAGRDIKKK
ncbi:hypothetical protein [Polaromonas sp.]|uniref:hypothetical protein n=1 Tax=Polaromonas sp. TaxID=1869339 RepID=UPI003BAB302F